MQNRNRDNRTKSDFQQKQYPGISPKDYFDKDGDVVVDLFNSKADDIAKSFDIKRTSISQVRKFYDEILRMKMKIFFSNNKEREFKKQLPYIKMILAKAVYSSKRGNIDKNFKEFLDRNIGEIKELKEFEIFCDLFESVVAYSILYLKKK